MGKEQHLDEIIKKEARFDSLLSLSADECWQWNILYSWWDCTKDKVTQKQALFNFSVREKQISKAKEIAL